MLENTTDQLTYLMSWRQSYNKEGQWVDDHNSATDGDLYIAAALHRAAKVLAAKGPLLSSARATDCH